MQHAGGMLLPPVQTLVATLQFVPSEQIGNRVLYRLPPLLILKSSQQSYRLPSAFEGLSHGLKKYPPDTFLLRDAMPPFRFPYIAFQEI